MSKRHFEPKDVTDDEIKELEPINTPVMGVSEKKQGDPPEWMLKPDGKGGYAKILYDEKTYKRNIKNGWKVE